MLKPLFVLFKIGGLYPQCTKGDKYWTVLSVGIQSLSLWAAFFFYFRLDWHRLATYTNLSLYVSFYLSGIIHAVKVFYSKQSLMGLNERYDSGTLSEAALKYRFEVATFTAIVIILSVRTLVRCLAEMSWLIVLQILLKDLSTTISYLPIVQQTLLIRQLTARFSALNDQLKTVQGTPQNDHVAKLSSMFDTHAHLRDLVEQINSYFSTFNIINFTSRLLSIAYVSYFILLKFTESAKGFLFFDLAILLTVLSITVYHVEVCYQCSEKAKETVIIAHGLVHNGTPLEVMKQIKMFSLTMFDHPVQFTVAGVFTLNRNLLTKATLASMACIIVALQIKDLNIPTPAATASHVTPL